MEICMSYTMNNFKQFQLNKNSGYHNMLQNQDKTDSYNHQLSRCVGVSILPLVEKWLDLLQEI